MEGNGRYLIELLSWLLLGGTEEDYEKYVSVFDFPNEIRTDGLRDTSLDWYRCGNLLGEISILKLLQYMGFFQAKKKKESYSEELGESRNSNGKCRESRVNRKPVWEGGDGG
jgi:hypothetical protein